MRRNVRAHLLVGFATVLAVAACTSGRAPPAVHKPGKWQGKTFEEFKASVYKEKFPGGKYIVNGDTAIADEKQLREFFEEKVLQHNDTESDGRLITSPVHGIWSNASKKKLTYCVSDAFGERKAKVVMDMVTATGAWESVADVKYSHVEAQDAACLASNKLVMFDVRPVSGESYLARSFFPNEPRPDRSLLVNESAFDLDEDDQVPLAGTLRHELGHVLGFRHEQIRLGAGACVNGDEDDLGVFVAHTPYDAKSVMHYPQCHGSGDYQFNLTAIDKSGAACNYGAAPGFVIDSTLITGRCAPPVPEPQNPGVATETKFPAQSVAAGATQSYGPFAAKPGTTIEVAMTPAGSAEGDADLFVRLGLAPTLAPGDYNCRPFVTGSTENCEVSAKDTPRNAAFVLVHGKSAANYDLVVRYVPE
jgi:hypothetical protein